MKKHAAAEAAPTIVHEQPGLCVPLAAPPPYLALLLLITRTRWPNFRTDFFFLSSSSSISTFLLYLLLLLLLRGWTLLTCSSPKHVSCLYVPCRTEFVWIKSSRKYDSTGIHGQLKYHVLLPESLLLPAPSSASFFFVHSHRLFGHALNLVMERVYS